MNNTVEIDISVAKKLLIEILIEHMGDGHGTWPHCEVELCQYGVVLEKALAKAGVWLLREPGAISP